RRGIAKAGRTGAQRVKESYCPLDRVILAQCGSAHLLLRRNLCYAAEPLESLLPMMRSFLVLALALVSSLPAAALSFGSASSLDDGWMFSLQDESTAAEPGFDDRGWEQVTLPHDWSVKAPLSSEFASGTGYLPGGVGWYRRTVFLPARGGEKVFLYFEGIYNRSEVY